jgi:hypothetical protein
MLVWPTVKLILLVNFLPLSKIETNKERNWNMELFVVDHGDSFDRFPVGVARSLDEARRLAVAYMEFPWYSSSQYSWFGVCACTLGAAGVGELQVLDLDEVE